MAAVYHNRNEISVYCLSDSLDSALLVVVEINTVSLPVLRHYRKLRITIDLPANRLRFPMDESYWLNSMSIKERHPTGTITNVTIKC